ncbi:MAG: hypothetical protein HFH38_11335 [Lachnospiraceae bacterium]|jgi:hypothetical protein|nr:hypothetical protein [Lachnospiraceae bacterium]
MKQCKICGLWEDYTNIHLNEEGICNYCEFYESHKDALEDKEGLKRQFAQKMEAAKAKAQAAGSDYDCLVGFSGGKDSTYIIYQLKETYGMRVLAFTFDNGFSTDYGRLNIENALSKLNVDHITFSMNDEKLRKQYAACVKIMHNFCSVCFHYMHYYSYLFAGQHKIPLIVNGRTSGQILQCADSTKGIEPFESSFHLKEFEYQMFHGLEERADRAGRMDYLKDIEAEAVSYFAYHDISEEETMRFLEEKIGWTRPQGTSGHADCFAHAMAEHMSIEKRGFPIRTGELAVLVRRGKMTKEEAQDILKQDYENFKEIPQEDQDKFYQRISTV